MTQWLPCGAAFVPGDVVRWSEAVWLEKGKRRKKLVKVGERRVTGEVLSEDGKGFVVISVLQCEVLTNLAARALEPFTKGHVIRRKRSTIGRGSGERLQWSDEAARGLTVSKFLGGGSE